MISFDEFIVLVYKHQRETRERLGQAFFNVLAEVNPRLAKEIRGTDRDPFYWYGLGFTAEYVADRWEHGKGTFQRK